ncbi:MAG: 30S ribosomal protein S2 [Microscillaceae bacterium]|nr:30S ribosomal protein S2 [Microscillaceae bacterium]
MQVEYKDLLDAGVHFGHLTRKWDPRMAPYIFMEKNGIHLIDINKTLVCLQEATNAVRSIVRSGKKIMFVATKKQAKDIVTKEAQRLKMPFVTDRWLGGMLTNFATVRKSLKKMSSIDKLMKEDTFQNLAKRERLTITREREKLERLLGGIADLSKLPAALFVVDIKKENIAVLEAQRLGIPIIGMVDTNSNPNEVDFPIPANDDAFKSIYLITKAVADAIEEGMSERKREKDDQKLQEEEDAKRALDMGEESEEEVIVPVAQLDDAEDKDEA